MKSILISNILRSILSPPVSHLKSTKCSENLNAFLQLRQQTKFYCNTVKDIQGKGDKKHVYSTY